MFFELHEENKIGYKVLSKADLGVRESSHQTHIGLSKYVLTFLQNKDELNEDSIFIYDNKFEYIDAYFDRIERANGTYDAPKTRTGGISCVSVVSTIREIVSTHDNSLVWCLLWFGLKNEKIVFFLFNNKSDDYLNIEEVGLKFDKKWARAIGNDYPSFNLLVYYLENKINDNGTEILRELEVVSQTQELKNDKRFKKYDIEKANENFQITGRTGEALISKYLDKKLNNGQITNFTWHNEHGESGLPYDFTVQDLRENIFYLDVKTTSYDFKQKMIFSTQEIKFIAHSDKNYSIYRVYKNKAENYFLKICDNCEELSKKIWLQTKVYIHELTQLEVSLKTAKLAISPETQLLNFKQEEAISIS